MMERTEACIIEILSRQAGQTLSLQRLHQALVGELGAVAGSYHQLHQRLKQARGAFQILERPGPLIGEWAWPLDVHEQYRGALRNAGIDQSPLVSLAIPPDDTEPGILGALQQTLAGLRSQRSADPVLAADLLAALSDLPHLQEALERVPPTTTPPRDPPAEP